MLELFFLLLPVAVAYGWYMGRRNLRQKQTSQQKQLSRDYFAGLNFLLSNESDKAVDMFISMLDVDDETIDTHLSLGSLFRKRGEVDRAIRIHQNLIARPSLLNEQRDLAMMELGKDFLAAGFYDRAEEIFLNLIQLDDHSEEAESQLISIYQMTKEWQKAINIIKKLPRKRQQTLKSVLAHFYCQLADESRNVDEQISLLKIANKQDPCCGRALLKLIRLYLAQHQAHLAGEALDQLIDKAPSLVVDALTSAVELADMTRDRAGLKRRLALAVEKGAGASVIIALAKLLVDDGELKAAESLILDNLYRHPTMRGFQFLMKMQLAQAEEGQAKESLAMLEKLVEQQIRSRPVYRCCECGFPSHTLYWHCPSCKSWGSIQHIRGLDGE
ncbi:lipopolysaccharide assembly protein LapB [Shewanella avicenniae]|uniref:Lipopolysaccharide assembly protein B n=1 Tax=Shewanella avicenniae TaxID=2814294 RepID=A0ABX7QUQ2_9GAMM|nr:lipopolysaccharide assembly protein LapB [Shewanella avicenniae]QSX35223.1 lipopolysaccharide assembly protein LapB [Shewanella avicenniae]